MLLRAAGCIGLRRLWGHCLWSLPVCRRSKHIVAELPAAHVTAAVLHARCLQESQRECAEVAEHVSRLGISVDVQRALLPLPDQPYISCMARLPRPGAAGSGAAKVKPGKKKKLKTKGAAKKGAKAQAAVKKKQK